MILTRLLPGFRAVLSLRGCFKTLAPLALLTILSAEVSVALSPGTGSFSWDDTTGHSDPDKTLQVYYYRPEVVTSDTPVWVVMHGASRNADDYRDYFVSAATAQGALVIAPEFSDFDWPNSISYNLGNVSVSESDLTPREKQDWSFSKIEPMFDYVVDVLEPTLETDEYFMFGHSAGSQFTHRFLQWVPDARVKLAVAANAGWYTMPQYNDSSYPHDWPYSLTNIPDLDASTVSYDPFPTANLEHSLTRETVVLLGDQDQAISGSLRQTVQANAQGIDRFERGQFFFSEGQDEAVARGVGFGWQLQVVPGVGHDGSQMAIAAADLFRRANLSADFDQNGYVETADLTQWESDYGLNGDADADGDGNSNGLDFLAWQREYPPVTVKQNYYFVGPSGGNFFNEANWNTAPDGSGSTAPAGSLTPGSSNPEDDITLELVIDGNFAVASGNVDIGEGGVGSLTLINGARLDVRGSASDLDIDFDGSFYLNDSTLNVEDNLFLGGQVKLTNGTISVVDDIETEAFAELSIDGTTLAANDNIEFFNFSTASTVVGATFAPSDRLALNSDSTNLVMTDVTIIVENGTGDIEDLAGDLTDSAGTLTLLGSSDLQADDLDEGADLILGDLSTATLGGGGGSALYVGNGGSTVTLLSSGASLLVPSITITTDDPRDFIINGVTGLSYADDPSTWNITNWNGEDAATLQITSSGTVAVVPEPRTICFVTPVLCAVLLYRANALERPH